MRLRHFTIPSLVFIVLLVSPILIHAWEGKVVGVHDGDTISVMRDGEAVKVRLAGVDCPEIGQPYGKRAKRFVSDLAFGKEVQVRAETKDKYGRIVGWVTLPDGTLDYVSVTVRDDLTLVDYFKVLAFGWRESRR